MESCLVDRADLLLASSEAMVRLLPSSGPRKAKLLPNAADTAVFMAAERTPCPPDLRNIPRPRIGYTGAINLKVDLSLVRELALRRPEWNWIFVGPVREMAPQSFAGSREYTESLAACRSLRNVHFLGPKAVQEVPAYVAHMDVNTMCYRTDPGGWWTALYPLKLHEYLAAGRPVVGANLETLRAFASVLTIAETADDWVLAIETGLAADDPIKKQARRTVALQNTWDQRIDQLVGWLQQAETP
jgi:glycosyltransferase involved in cell wall biosynthesis